MNDRSWKISQNFKLAILVKSEAVVQTYSTKEVFLEILVNSQENTCVRVSILIKLQT